MHLSKFVSSLKELFNPDLKLAKLTPDERKQKGFLTKQEIEEYRKSVKPVFPTHSPAWEKNLTDEVIKVVHSNPGKEISYVVANCEVTEREHPGLVGLRIRCISKLRKWMSGWGRQPYMFAVRIEADKKLARVALFESNQSGISFIGSV